MIKNVAVILDKNLIQKWQLECLQNLCESIEIVAVLNCLNTKNKKNFLKNFLYYVLNLFTLRNKLTKREKFFIDESRILSFYSEYSGNWQIIPENTFNDLKIFDVDIIIKFGMNLLQVNEAASVPPILSFHHGDPAMYRGRPAGFYEILNGEKTLGIVVQKISNKLDAGEIYAFARSKVINFSYKKTAKNFYLNSIPLLKKAINNFSNDFQINIETAGKNYRLPSNALVIRFFGIIVKNGIHKILYGLFFEKKWKVAVTRTSLQLSKHQVFLSSEFFELPISKQYNFYADPFFTEDGQKIRLEALGKKTGLGDILEIETGNFSDQKVILSGQHYSYPASFHYQGIEFLLPEVASHSAQYFTSVHDNFTRRHFIKGLENKRIVDATLFIRGSHCYLFFGEADNAQSILNLWISESPFGIFKPHPATPISISPIDARMGGKILNFSGKLIRFGQDNSGQYGESLGVFEITKINQSVYEEKKIGVISIDKYYGPHSLNFDHNSNDILIDYYVNKFSIFAGVRRIRAKLAKKI